MPVRLNFKVLALEYEAGATTAELGRKYGVSDETIRRELVGRAHIDMRPASRRPRQRDVRPAFGPVWCCQCERRVKPDEVLLCRSQWCRAKANFISGLPENPQSVPERMTAGAFRSDSTEGIN